MTPPVVVVNPSAANGATGRHWPTLARRLGRVLGSFQTVFTTQRGEGTQLARRAVEGGATLVVSVGGDGTHNEVVNGLFPVSEGGAGLTMASPADLMVIPSGTGGDLRRSLGLPAKQAEVLVQLGAGHPRRALDLGRLTFTTDNGATASRLFLNVSSCGVSGLVVELANRSGKWLGGKASFAVASLRALNGFRDQTIELRLDDQAPRRLAITTLAVANGQYFGGGMRVAPAARTDDGWLDVTLWSGFGLADFVLRAPRLYQGTHLELPGAEAHRVRRVEAFSEEEVLVELDGERPGRLPARWEVLPGALWLRGCRPPILAQ